jgi:hypothetical protein
MNTPPNVTDTPTGWPDQGAFRLLDSTEITGKEKAIGHIRFVIVPGKNHFEFNVNLSANFDSKGAPPMSKEAFVAILSSISEKIVQGKCTITSKRTVEEEVPSGLRYEKFKLQSDPPKKAPRSKSREELAASLEAAARSLRLEEDDCDMAWELFFLVKELIDTAFFAAMNGEFTSQRTLYHIAQAAVDRFLEGALVRAPGVIHETATKPWIPGFMGVAKEVGSEMLSVCRKVNQGNKFPFPLASPGIKGVKRKANLATPQNRLVHLLFTYMESFRHNAGIYNGTHKGGLRAILEKHGSAIPNIVKDMMNLPPCSPATVQRWKSVSRDVIEDATNGNPASHPAFLKGGRFARLGMPSVRAKRQEIKLWKRLGEAWDTWAEGMAASEKDSASK